MNIKGISRNVGFALLVSALFMLLSVVVSIIDGVDSAFAPLSISFIITLIIGSFPFIFVRRSSNITLKEGYLTIVLSWLLSFICGMLPYVLWGGPFTVANAWFESVSGFTTTGATVLNDIEALPRSLLFWRSSTHFIGGLGVVVFLLLIIPDSSPVRLRLTNMELSSLSRQGYGSRTNKTVYIFAYVYIGLAVSAFICYVLAGMNVFDAVNHAFSVCSTGGFSTKNLSIGAFDSKLIEGITMVFMFLGSIHFGIIFMTVCNRTFKAFGTPVLKFYVASIVVFTFFLALSLRLDGIETSFGNALWDSAFQTLSIFSTTGLAVVDNSAWPMVPNTLILMMGIMCGCAGSTTGGLKADRVLLLFKSVANQINSILHPRAINEVRIGRKYFSQEEVAPHLLYIALYGLILVISSLLALALGVNSHSAFAASISSLGNVGPAVAELGFAGNFSSVPDAAKYLFTLDMFLGRVEIYPVMAVIAMMFSRREK